MMMYWVSPPAGDAAAQSNQAVRLAWLGQGRLTAVRRELAAVVPIFALGADEIIMGPPSDLGPIDPQVLVPERGYVSAKEVIAAVDGALADVSERPGTYALHSALLGMGNVDATLYQVAASALGQTKEIARQAVASNPRRSEKDVADLVEAVAERLITDPRTHSAVIGAAEARNVGFPVNELKPSS